MVFTAKRVAIIGAGVSGVTSAKYLKAAGVEVIVYERSAQAGGNWAYDERQPPEPRYPSERPSEADFIPHIAQSQEQRRQNHTDSLSESSEQIELEHGPPGPAYDGLTSNISTVLQELKDFPWPEGTEDFVNVRVKGQYIQDYARHFGIEPLIRYNTRVEKLSKSGSKWHLSSSTLVKIPGTTPSLQYQTQEFDAVIVASGHYHAAKVPSTPGLFELKAAVPTSITHSKSYRRPDEFKDKTILLIGAGVSSSDVARETVGIAKKIYQSSRGSPYDIPLSFIPPEVERVGEVASYSIPEAGQKGIGNVNLVDGRVLEGIDRVVLCTGYYFSYPFLRDLHADDTPPQEVNETTLVTDGYQIHNLHKDIYYIPDPTLAFVGVPFYTSTFTLFEYQAITVAAVFSGHAWLPSASAMRAEYNSRVEAKGNGRAFHSLRDQQVPYVDELLEWINTQAEVTGAEKVEGYSDKWLEEDKLKLVKMKALFEAKEEWQRDEQLRKGEGDNEEVKKLWGKLGDEAGAVEGVAA